MVQENPPPMTPNQRWFRLMCTSLSPTLLAEQKVHMFYRIVSAKLCLGSWRSQLLFYWPWKSLLYIALALIRIVSTDTFKFTADSSSTGPFFMLHRSRSLMYAGPHWRELSNIISSYTPTIWSDPMYTATCIHSHPPPHEIGRQIGLFFLVDLTLGQLR